MARRSSTRNPRNAKESEIRHAHASAGSSCRTAELITSVEKIAMLVDVRRKVERVLPDQPLGQFGIAALQRLDDAHVIGDRSGGAVLLRDRHAADRPDVHE